MSNLHDAITIYKGAHVRSGKLVATVKDIVSDPPLTNPQHVLVVEYPDGQEDLWYLKDTYVEPISKKEYFAEALKYKRLWA